MKIITTNLPGVIVFEPKKFGDKRGFFLETFRADVLQDVENGMIIYNITTGQFNFRTGGAWGTG